MYSLIPGRCAEPCALEIYARTGTMRLANMTWESVYHWVTWANYATRQEAAAVGESLVAGSPRECFDWRVTP